MLGLTSTVPGRGDRSVAGRHRPARRDLGPRGRRAQRRRHRSTLEPGTSSCARPRPRPPSPMLVAGDPDYDDGRAEVDDIGGEPRPSSRSARVPRSRSSRVPACSATCPSRSRAPRARSRPSRCSSWPARTRPTRCSTGCATPEPDRPRRSTRPAAASAPQQRAEDRVRRAGLVAAIGLGLLALAAGGRRRRRAIAHDDAALRLVGVPRPSCAGLGCVEAAVLAVARPRRDPGRRAGWPPPPSSRSSGLVPTGPARLPLDASPLRSRCSSDVAVAAALATRPRGAAGLAAYGAGPPGRR